MLPCYLTGGLGKARLLVKPAAVAYPTKIVPPAAPNVAEIFSAVQGEGTLVGERHLFVRLGGCPFRCHYCDTPGALVPSATCRVESPPGSRRWTTLPNPMTPDALLAALAPFWVAEGLHRTVAFTGGEPLWQAPYLAEVLPRVKALGRRVYLETAGAHPTELRTLLDHVDVVAMDLKPPSSTGMKPLWAAHREFLRVAIGRQVIVKIVVTKHTATQELEQCRDLVAEIDRTIPVVLQPVTPAWKVKAGPSMSQLLGWQALLARRLDQVRIIPQIHKILNEP